ncbi:hypothetical protein AVEN_220938-1, partial [Araneus ventricosus]
MFSIEYCIIQLATPVSNPGSRSSALSTTNCEEKKGEGGRVHFTNPYVNKTSVYKGSKILRAARSQRVKDGALYRKWENDDGSSCQWQLILPRSRIQEVLQETHDSSSGGHFGIMKTLRRIRERFYWDRLRADVEKWCRECQICRARKRLKTEDGKSVTGWISAEKLSD